MKKYKCKEDFYMSKHCGGYKTFTKDVLYTQAPNFHNNNNQIVLIDDQKEVHYMDKKYFIDLHEQYIEQMKEIINDID